MQYAVKLNLQPLRQRLLIRISQNRDPAKVADYNDHLIINIHR